MSSTHRWSRTIVVVALALLIALAAIPALATAATVATVQGTVSNSSAVPLAGIHVVIQGVTIASPYWAEYTTGPNGTYTFSVPEAGDYSVRADDPSSALLVEQHYLTNVSAGVVTSNFTLMAPGGIAGTVTDAMTLSPIQHIEVQSVRLAGDFEYWDGTKLTDQYGRYAISGANPGPHAVYFYDGANRAVPYAPQWYGGATLFSGATTVAVAEGATTMNINAALASDTVLGGRVYDVGSTTPLGSTIITIQNDNTADLAWLSTSADGTYRIAGLPAGTYTVAALSPQDDYTNFSRVVSLVDNQVLINVDFAMTPTAAGYMTGRAVDAATSPLSGIEVSLAMGVPTDHNPVVFSTTAAADGTFSLPPRTGPITLSFFDPTGSHPALVSPLTVAGPSNLGDFALGASATISGSVTDMNAQPIAGAFARLWKASDSVAPVDSAVVGLDGRYSFGDLQAGDYKLSFDADAYQPEFYDNAADFAGANAISAPAGGAVTANAVLLHLPPLATVHGTIRGAGGSPLEGAHVIIQGQSLVTPHWADAVTGADGRYSFSVPAPGDYLVTAEDPSGALASESHLVTGLIADTTVIADLTLGGTGSISGSVVESGSSTPVQQIDVASLRLAGDFEYWDGVAQTDRNGDFTIAEANAGPHAVEFSDASLRAVPFASQWYDGVTEVSAATPVNVSSGINTPHINAGLVPATSISGKVVDSVNGMPVGDTIIQVLNDNTADQLWTSASADGTFLVTGLPAGTYTVLAQSLTGDYADTSALDVVLDASHTSQVVNFSLAPAATGYLTGRVLDASAAPLAGIEVGLAAGIPSDNGPFLFSTVTDANGAFSLPPRTGDITLSFSDRTGAHPGLVVTRVANGPADLGDFALGANGVISGSITGVGGRPIAGAFVRLWKASDSVAPIDSASSGLDGGYSFGDLVAGDYKLSFDADTYETEYYDNAATFASASVVHIQSGDHLAADAVLSHQPHVTELSSYAASVGTPLTITGTGFGANEGSGLVTFGGVTTTALSWSETKITVLVPEGAVSGYAGVWQDGVCSNGLYFVPVTVPTVSAITPDSAPVGSEVVFTGTGFGATEGSGLVTFGGVTTTAVSWSDTSIHVIVPDGAVPGYAGVWQNGVCSNGIMFTLGVVPTIDALSAAQAPVGTSVNITGSGFGATQGLGLVTLGGEPCTVTSWSDTSVSFTVPDVAAGYVGVWRDGICSNGKWLQPVARVDSLSSWTAPPNAEITITGAGFGASQGTSRVTFGGMDAVITNWSATSVTALVPAGASAGYVGVWKDGACSNGVYFLPLAPASISGLAPLSGPVGTTVTITGTGFGAAQGSGDVVTFAGVEASVVSWSDTEITADVPVGATSGYVGVWKSGVASNGYWFEVTP